MKYWYKSSKNAYSCYFEPLSWSKLTSLFNEDCPVTIEHFIGSNKEKQIYYKTTHDVSSELNLFKDSISFGKLTEIVEKLRLYVFEYKLNIDNTLIERAVVEGAILTGDQISIQRLIGIMKLPESLIKSSINGELAKLWESGEIQIEGTFENTEDLLEFIYNDLMEKECPGYNYFMDRLWGLDNYLLQNNKCIYDRNNCLLVSYIASKELFNPDIYGQ